MSDKTILCRCEDVTLHDIEHAVRAGTVDLEELKRYTGFGTGTCQGKECLSAVADVVARCSGKVPVAPFTARAPLVPTSLRSYATDPLAHRFADDAALTTEADHD